MSRKVRGSEGVAGSSISGVKRSRAALVGGGAATKTPGEWKKGQIVRLRLHNFLTFDDVELHPSPHLNVIVGPNGTGKSSIVCAICVGLGGRPTLLGRAKELKDYVKHGTVEGWVELELCSGHSSRNWAIRRLLNCDSNTSSWMLNGKEVLKKEVEKVVSDLHIQLENKCQFLPQDMVVEFAKMDACSLLEETEKAIGPEDLHANHLKLKDLQKNQHSSKGKIEEKMRQRELEHGRNQLLQRDVERFNNRKMFLARIKHLRMKKYWMEYQEGRAKFQEAKEARKKAVREFRAATNNYQPIATKHDEQEKAVAQFVKNSQMVKEKWRRSMKTHQSCKEKLEGQEDEVDTLAQELEEKKKEEAKRRNKVATLQKEIQAYTKELEQMEKPAAIAPLISEKNSQLRAVSGRVGELKQQMTEISQNREEYIQQMRRCEDELGQMHDVRNQRLRLLQRVDRQTHDAVVWLNRHRELFKEHVFEPILLSVNVLDASYTSQVEAALASKDFFSFVTLNKEDKSTLLQEVNDRMRLKINVVLAPNRQVSSFRPDNQSSTLSQYGFRGMIMDLIEAPEPLLVVFCQFHNLHNVPLASDLSPEQLEKIMERLPSLRRFFTHDTQYTLTRSRYSDKVIVKSSKTQPARFLVASVDVQRKMELEQEIEGIGQSLKEQDSSYDDLKKKDDDLRKEDSALRQEKNGLKVKIDSYKQAQSNISSRQTRLQGIQDTTLDTAAEEERLQREVDKIHQRRLEVLAKLNVCLKESKLKVVEYCKSWALVSMASLKVTLLIQRSSEAKTRLEAAEQAKVVREAEEATVKERVQQLLQTARRQSGINDPQENQELMGIFNTLPDELDAVEEEIHEYQAQADLCVGIAEEEVREYEEREKRIKHLDKEIERMRERSTNAETEMSDMKERWLTPLKELLGKVSVRFSEYFRMMACVGEVALYSDTEDFNQYSVKISVKFRDSEQLQALNAQRQSGGERSVSTMLYLMSLQGITSCPFRVVDEINQGMDAVNERRVFEMIVSATSMDRDSSQYFILTPKILQGMKYTEQVTVHVVHNGQEVSKNKHWMMSDFL